MFRNTHTHIGVSTTALRKARAASLVASLFGQHVVRGVYGFGLRHGEPCDTTLEQYLGANLIASVIP
jgi:hypothetical protein